MLFGAFVESYGRTLNFLTNGSGKAFLLSRTLALIWTLRRSSWAPSEGVEWLVGTA